MTRNGKIARLPSIVREEVNKRLRKGEPGKYLVAWLNSVPKVQGILKKHFQGYAVTEQNLSKWRRGGFEDWLGQHAAIESTFTLAGDSEELQPQSAGGILRPMRCRTYAEQEPESVNRTESKPIRVDPTKKTAETEPMSNTCSVSEVESCHRSALSSTRTGLRTEAAARLGGGKGAELCVKAVRQPKARMLFGGNPKASGQAVARQVRQQVGPSTTSIAPNRT